MLGHSPLAEVQQAQVEHVEGLLATAEGVVPRGLVGLLGDAIVEDVLELQQHVGRVGGELQRGLDGRVGAHAEDVEQQHRVVGHHGAARLGHDVGVGLAGLVAGAMNGRDDVVCVLLHAVVHRAGEVGGRAVVVHAQATADVQVLQVRTELAQLHKHPAGFLERRLEGADGADLGADVEVQQLEGVEQVVLREKVNQVDNLKDGQAELGLVAGAGFPPACALAGELGPHPEQRRDAMGLGEANREVDLAELLDDDDGLATHLLGQHGRLDVLFVLVAIADDDGLGVVHQGQHDEHLGL